MPEPFDFTRHLREVVGPVLSPLGFKHKGSQYIRQNGDMKDYIWFQRDRYNSLYTAEKRPCRFFLNLNTGRTNGEYNSTHLRLINPAARRVPLWWFQLTEEQQEQQWSWLNEGQKKELLAIQDSKDWWYFSEEELCHRFSVAAKEIADKGLKYLEQMAARLGSPDFPVLREEAIKLATGWYDEPAESASTPPPTDSPHSKGVKLWYRRLWKRRQG